MKIRRVSHYFIVILVFFSLISKVAFADTGKVTFIYVPGILSVNPASFEKDAKSLHRYFANKKLGKYTISPEYKIAHWGTVPREERTFELFQDGLVNINSENNRSKCKQTYESKLSLLFNPIYRFLLLGDSGSSAQVVFWRNYIHNHIFDVIWFYSEQENKEKVFNIIQSKINESDGKFILIGNSFGAVIALNFVLDNIALNENNTKFNKSNYDNFLGLITTGDASNTVFAPIWHNQVSPEEYELKNKNFIRYFIENDKFWISCNHRSDIISTGIAPIITSYNNMGGGFIVSKINKASPLENYILAFKLWDRSNGLLRSHNWCFYKPKEFTNSIIKTYKENSTGKSTTLKK